MILAFFEIEIVPVVVVYGVYLVPGLIGFSLGVWRWWLGLIWLIFPMSLVFIGYAAIQHDEIMYFYDFIVRQSGYSYIVHNFVAPVIGLGICLTGIVIGKLRRHGYQPA